MLLEIHLDFTVSFDCRLTGVPNIFGHKTTQYVEAISYNNSRRLPGFAFGIVLKAVDFEELLIKLFGSRQQRGTWLQQVDCGGFTS